MIIAREDHGDLAAAARRLQLPLEDMQHLEDVLASETPRKRAVLLASVVRTYRTDACWLLTGSEATSLTELPPETRLEVAQLLSEIGTSILAQYRERISPPQPPS